MKKYILYALVSTSDLFNYRYIGATCQNPKERLRCHLKDKIITHKTNWIKSELKKGYKIKLIQLLDNIDNTKIETLEINFIKKYKKKGFNLTNTTLGGEGVKGVKWDDNRRNKINAQRKEINRKISKANKGRKYNLPDNVNTNGAICQFDLSGNLINEFRSVNNASVKLKINSESIRLSCLDKSYQTNGFIFIFKDKYSKEYIINKINLLNKRWSSRSKETYNKRKKKIDMFDLNMNYIKTYDSILDTINDGYTHVTEVCKLKRKTNNGKIFRYH